MVNQKILKNHGFWYKIVLTRVKYYLEISIFRIIVSIEKRKLSA